MVRMGDKLGPVQDPARQGTDDGLLRGVCRRGRCQPAVPSRVGPRIRRPSNISPMIGRHGIFLSEEQAMVFAIDDSPFNMIGASKLDSRLDRQSGEGRTEPSGMAEAWLGRPEHLPLLHDRAVLPPRLRQPLIQSWLPALDGVVEKLTRGANVADVGCGCGYSTVIMAKAFPNSQFVGFDFHADSIVEARSMRGNTERRKCPLRGRRGEDLSGPLRPRHLLRLSA